MGVDLSSTSYLQIQLIRLIGYSVLLAFSLFGKRQA
jgi:hypothetical protein